LLPLLAVESEAIQIPPPSSVKAVFSEATFLLKARLAIQVQGTRVVLIDIGIELVKPGEVVGSCLE